MEIYLPIAEQSMNVFVLLALGGAAGLLAGMFGVGGGFLATPLLIFVGIPPAVAVASQANQVVANSVSSLQVQLRRGNVDIRMGDARLKLNEDSNRKYALLLVDAFSSDAIPVHLLTREAVKMYMERITDDGLLALHISNKFVKLEPVVAAIVRS